MEIKSVVNGYVEFVNGLHEAIVDMPHAEKVAALLTEKTNVCHLAVDRGSYVSPRYTVIEFSVKVGDEVSMGFNGDYYPQGKVAKVSDSKRIVTLENGKRFFRRRQTESWIFDQTWSLVPGTRDERNPSF